MSALLEATATLIVNVRSQGQQNVLNPSQIAFGTNLSHPCLLA
jgi:hypothetical protein